jgi:hypothetical protein
MKTNITIVLIFVALIGQSQLKLDSVTPTRICAGDSITYHFQWDGTPGLYQFDLAGQNHNRIWQISSSDFKNNTVTVKTDFWWNDGSALASVDWTNSFNITFCEQVGIEEYELNSEATYKKVYGNIYVKTLNGKKTKVIFVE